jgi:proline dehydrogenase
MRQKQRFAVGFLAILATAYFFGERLLRMVLLYLSTAVWARRLVTELPLAWRVASRFVAGEDLTAVVTTTRQLNEKGLVVTLNYLGEAVATAAEAAAARDQILALLDTIHEYQLQANVSIKPTQLGLKLDPRQTRAHLRHILERARQTHNKIRLDMEDSHLLDPTLQLYRALRDEDGFDNVGVVIQTYLYRSEDDIRQLISEGAWIRLVKGAYAEPPDRAYPNKADTDRNFIHLAHLLLSEQAQQNGVYTGFATHDDKMIEAIIVHAAAHNVSTDHYEFQMLYGVRGQRQEQLVGQGYRVRTYVPYGNAWYPYFMRRLAERPANLWFFLSNLFRQ